MVSVRDRRAAYEKAVRSLRGEADRLLRAGLSEEGVAREMVSRRNMMKKQARAEDNPLLVRILEARNRLKYGDPLGPNADTLLNRYGSWAAVIDAACRPAPLSKS